MTSSRCLKDEGYKTPLLITLALTLTHADLCIGASVANIDSPITVGASASIEVSASEYTKQAAKDYKVLFAPPDGNANKDSWLVDIGPAPASASSDPVKVAKRNYAATRTPGGKIQGASKPRNVLWNGRESGPVASGTASPSTSSTGASTSTPVVVNNANSGASNSPSSGNSTGSTSGSGSSSGVNYGY